MMKLLVTLCTLLPFITMALASSEATCEDCKAVVTAIASFTTSKESIVNQIDILLAEVCPGAEDPEGCVEGLPGFWADIANILWPGYWDPEAVWRACLGSGLILPTSYGQDT